MAFLFLRGLKSLGFWRSGSAVAIAINSLGSRISSAISILLSYGALHFVRYTVAWAAHYLKS